MSEFLTTVSSAVAWLKGLAGRHELFFPLKHGSANYAFQAAGPTADIQFDHYRPTIVPPVKKMLPAHDTLFTFVKNPDGAPTVTPTLDAAPRVLAGVRPCDLKGIHLMDTVFENGVADAYYAARRANTAVIAYACPKPCDDRAFCHAVDSLDHRAGADVILTPLKGDEMLVEALTDKGKELLAGCDFPACADAAARKVGAVAARPEPFGRSLGAKVSALPEIIKKQWKSELWDKHTERCFSCGSCNLVCPTCYCFDVQDDLNLDTTSGHRTRTWDACMLPEFAAVAGGHNFRPNAASRQRHRVKRKFEYLTERFHEGAFCTGCGRCGRQCTAGIDILDIVKDLASAEVES